MHRTARTKTCQFFSVAMLSTAIIGCGAESSDLNEYVHDEDSVEVFETGTARSALTEAPAPEQYGGYAESELRSVWMDSIEFKAPTELITEDEHTLTVAGDLYLETPAGPITLDVGIGQLVFDKGADGSIQTVAGEVTMPIVNLGFLSEAIADDLPRVAIGYDYGADISEDYYVQIPLQNDNKYLYFSFQSGAYYDVGGVSIGMKKVAGKIGALIIDPLDPMFGLWGDLGDFSKLGKVENVGVAFSLNGQIPYSPDADWFLEEDDGTFEELTSFDGHLYLRGTVPLSTLPVQLDGQITIDVDNDDDGKTVFTHPEEGSSLGFNGTFYYDFPFDDDLKKVVEMSLKLGDASAAITLSDEEQGGFFSGQLQNPSELLPSNIPISLGPDVELKVAGLMYSEAFNKSFFEIQGEINSLASQFPLANAIPLSDGVVGDGRLRIDGEQLLLTGTLSESPVSDLSFSGDAEIEMIIPWKNPNEFSFAAYGKMTAGGVDLGEAFVQIDSSGVVATGSYTTGLSTIAVTGEFTAKGFELTGTQTTTIPLSYIDETIEWVTDAALCGYDTVTDAGKCGTKWVTSTALCGTKWVTSSAKCGTQYVTDAAKCGTSSVTSAAQCGTSYVTSAAKCGTSYVTSASKCGTETVKSGSKCGYNWVKNVLKGKWKKKPKSCKVAKSCTTANSCNVPKTCTIENSCNVAKSCSVSASCNTPKTCNVDATCEQKTQLELPFGDFEGEVAITIGTSGVSGDVSGSYCNDINGKCDTIASGSVKFGNPNQACVNVPIAGNHCTKF